MRAQTSIGTGFGLAIRDTCLRVGVLSILVVSISVLTSCREPVEESVAKPISLATIGDHDITISEFNAEKDWRREKGRPIGDDASLLNELVLKHAFLQRARRERVDEDPEVRRALDGLLIAKLKDQNLPSVTESVEIADAEIEAEYQRRISEFTRPEKVRLAMLFKETQPGFSDARLSEMREEFAEALRLHKENPPTGGRGPATIGFGSLAVNFSEDQISRYRGGDMGWLEVGRFEYRFPKTVLESGYALSVNELSGIIETDRGMYVVTKTDQRAATVTPFADVKEILKTQLASQARDEQQRLFVDESLRASGATIHTNNLQELVGATQQTAHARMNQSASPIEQ